MSYAYYNITPLYLLSIPTFFVLGTIVRKLIENTTFDVLTIVSESWYNGVIKQNTPAPTGAHEQERTNV